MASWTFTCLFVLTTVIVLPGPAVRAEVFTALVHMEGLISLEKDLLGGLESYLELERKRLGRIEQFASRVSSALQSASQDPTAHLSDPVNAYQLVNRFINGWANLHDDIYEDNGQALMANISYNHYQFPDREDLSGAATAILRLQDTYRLSPSLITSGKLGSTTTIPMTSEESFQLALDAYNRQDYRHSRDWMKETIRLLDEEGHSSTVDLTDVYDYLAFSEYKMGNLRRSSHYTRLLLQTDPTHSRAQRNLAFYEELIRSQPEKFINVDDDGGEEEEELTEETIEAMTNYEKYESLCRAPWPLPKEYDSELMCFYYDNHRTPGLVIRPVKVEVVFPKPRLFILRGILSEREMDRLKELAGPKLRRATARNADSGKDEPAHYRISKSGWLSSRHDPLGYVDRIDQRIEDLTGLTMSTAEQLQVVNYGIGGHYEPHYDFGTDEASFTEYPNRNRIATVLFYMSDVELGGATVFPIVGARIKPSKGDAAFWWNLKMSGEGDMLTRHAGCPVLVGSKWVCNKWIHEGGQEFRRRCGLNPDEETYGYSL